MKSILKVGPDELSEDAEVEFELAYLARLTTAQRFEMMLRRSREMAPSQVVKRA